MKDQERCAQKPASRRPQGLSAAPVSLVFALACCALAGIIAAQLGLTPVHVLVSTGTQRRYALGLTGAGLLTLASAGLTLRRLRSYRRLGPRSSY